MNTPPPPTLGPDAYAAAFRARRDKRQAAATVAAVALLGRRADVAGVGVAAVLVDGAVKAC